MDKDDLNVFKENIVEYRSKWCFKSFSKIMKDAKKYLKIDYEEEGIFKKKYLIRRSDFGKKIFFEEILICNFFLSLIDKMRIDRWRKQAFQNLD